VCIHRIPHESSIAASAGRGITLDQRHAAADQINSIVSRAKEKYIPKLQLREHKFLYRACSNILHHKSRGKINSYATFREHKFPHRSREMQVLSREEEN
jgi:hypothetical protein